MREVSNKLLHKSCPQCGSGRLYKAGFRYLKNKPAIQPFQCRECGHRFSEGHIVSKTDHRKYLNGEYAEGFKSPLRNSPRAITALKEKRRTGEAAGATEKAKVKGKIVEFAWHLKKQGDSEKTITTYLSILRTLWKNGADLLNPETVKDVLAKLDRSPNTKAVMTAAYTCFLKFLGRSWVPPKYQFQKKIPFIPLESEIDALIAGCGKKTSTILQLLKETAMRVGEALRLKWTDVNFRNNTIILNEPEKNSRPRMFKVSTKLIGMLNALPKKNERLFGSSIAKTKQAVFLSQRRRLAKKLGNPRLTRITFHTLRHWKATMEYHKTHDPWHVKTLLGHRSLQSTEIYINIEQTIFNEQNSEFHVKVASTIEEAQQLLEVGFDYVTDMEGKKLFRRRR